MAFTGDLWRECSRPISDLRVSRTVSMTKRLRSMIFSQGHQVVRHVSADTRNEVQAALPECLEQVLTDIAFVGVELARQMPGHFIQHGAVGGVAGGDLQRHDLALVVDDEVQLEAEKPPHAGLAARGQAIEDPVTVDAAIVTDSKLG